MMKSVCVFCGSKNGNEDVFTKEAFAFGRLLALKGLTLVYGGAKVGMMGAVADGVIHNGGKAIGVLPVFFMEKEIAHDNLDKLIMVDSMHERKVKLMEMSDAFVALPGGFGTLDELAEILTLNQLGKYRKPLGLLNTNGFFDMLMLFFKEMHKSDFIMDAHLKLLYSTNDSEKLLNWLSNYKAPEVKRWIR